MGAPFFWRLWHSMQAMLSSFLAFAKFGTRKGLLRYRICVPCSKRLPTVRDAFSEALRAQNRLLGYGRNIRYRKPPPTVRDAFSKAQNSRLRRLWTAFCCTECIFSTKNSCPECILGRDWRHRIPNGWIVACPQAKNSQIV